MVLKTRDNLIILTLFIISFLIITWFILHYVYSYHTFEMGKQFCIPQLYCSGEPIGPTSGNHDPTPNSNPNHLVQFYYQESNDGVCPRVQYFKFGTSILGMYEYNQNYNLNVFTQPTFFTNSGNFLDSGVCFYFTNKKIPATIGITGVSTWITDFWNQTVGVSVKKGVTTHFDNNNNWVKVDNFISIEKDINNILNQNVYNNLTALYDNNVISLPTSDGTSYFMNIYNPNNPNNIKGNEYLTGKSYGGLSIFGYDSKKSVATTGPNTDKGFYNPVDLLLATKLLNKRCENGSPNSCFCIDPSLVVDENNNVGMETLITSGDGKQTLDVNNYKNVSNFFTPKNIKGEYYPQNGKFFTAPTSDINKNGIGTNKTNIPIQQNYSLLCGVSNLTSNNNGPNGLKNYSEITYNTPAINSYGKFNKKLIENFDECGDLQNDNCKFITFPNKEDSY